MTRSTPYFSRATWQIRMLSSSSPVTAITRSARSMPPRSSTHSSDPSPYWAACSSSSSTVAKRDGSDSITVSSLPLSISSRARFQPTFPAPTTTTYMGLHGLQHGLLELGYRDLRRADRAEPLLLVPRGARRVEHPHHHVLDAEALLRDLRDHEVRVVAVGGRDEGVGAVDAGLDQRVDLERGADGERAPLLLPAVVRTLFE